MVVLDDATDPTTGVKNARRLVTEEKVDVILGSSTTPISVAMADVCLLYTSDAADERSSVDLGGRRIIKQKKTEKKKNK